MYQTLYRKYRPENFDEVVGQNVIVTTLKNEIIKNKLNHAYLFTGPRGTGKTSVAKILAKTINCINLKNTTPCNECVNCTQINNKQSNDIIEIDAASNNGIDEIRELKSKVNLVPSTGKYKIYIIDEVHMLTIGAFNALLKTLEEPPSHIIFILATTDPHKIPMTILSRCQRFDFKKISVNNLIKRLKEVIKIENIKIDEEAIYEIARLSDGGMRDALSMLDQVLAFSDDNITLNDVHEINGTLSQSQLKELIDSILSFNLVSEFNLIDTFDDKGKNIVKLTEEIVQFLKNYLLYKIAPTYFNTKNLNVEIFQNISWEINKMELLDLIKKFNSILSEMHNSNNPKLLLELLLIDLIKPISTTNILPELKNLNLKKEQKNINNKSEFINDNKSIEPVGKQIEQESLENKNSLELPINDVFKTIKKTRVNNALAGFNKKEVLNIQHRLSELKNDILDVKKSKYISMLTDANLKIVGNNYLIYVNSNKRLSNIFNYNILKIEKLLKDKFKENYKIISIDTEEWNVIKKEFNSKTKTYKLKEEDYDINEILKKITKQNSKSTKIDSDEISELFSEIIEYKEEHR